MSETVDPDREQEAREREVSDWGCSLAGAQNVFRIRRSATCSNIRPERDAYRPA